MKFTPEADALRDAYAAGVVWCSMRTTGFATGLLLEEARREAASRYPLLGREWRTEAYTDIGIEYRLNEGNLEMRKCDPWAPCRRWGLATEAASKLSSSDKEINELASLIKRLRKFPFVYVPICEG